MRWLVPLGILLCWQSVVWANTYERLGTFERQVVDRVLEETGLTVVEPGSKPIGTIHIVNLEVFSKDDGFLEWFNHFHRTTRDSTIRQELLIAPGQVWDQDLVDETLRKIRDPFWSNVVVILPVASSDAERVDVLVVTRDVWSLRFNTNFQVHDGVLRLLNTSLSENNLMGWRKVAALRFNMDRGIYWAGPYYSDPNLFGSRLQLQTQFSTIFNRHTNAYEGTESNITLKKPLWSLASMWAGSVQFTHTDYIARRYVGNEAVLEYDHQYYRAQASALASLGRRVKHHLSFGYRFSDLETALRQSTDVNALLPPPSRRDSVLTAGYRVYTPAYMEIRDVDSFDFREDYQVGPDVSLGVSQGLEELGADETYTGVGLSASWLFELPKKSLIQVSGSWYGRIQAASLVDHSAGAGVYIVTPRAGRFARFIARAKVRVRFRNGSGSLPYQLGGENGMRGYALGAFEGEAYLLTQLEMRTMPLHWGALRFGGVVFWDMGHATDRLSRLDPHHDLGIGLRLLIPQANSYVLRADWAFALQGLEAGWPGRFSFGFQQVF